MLKVTLYDARRWRDILNVISTLLEEAEFKASPQGLKLRAMDNSHTAMVDLDLPRTFFDRYECDRSTELCLNVKNVLDLLEGMSAKESIELNYNEKQARLIIYLRGEYQRVFSLTTLAIEEEFEREPKVIFKVSARVQTASLKKVITDSQKIGDQISIKTEPNTITFRTTGLAGSVVSTFNIGEAPLVKLSVDEESEARYSLDLLGTIIKNAPSVSNVINIEYSTEQVLRLDLELPQGKLHFYLSPMLEAS